MSDSDMTGMPRKKATIRLGQREMGRLSALVLVILALALFFGGYHLFRNFKSRRDIVIGRSNLLAIYKALNGYAQDWDSRLPDAKTWSDNVAGYLSVPQGTPGGPLSLLHGPGDNGTVGYVYNDAASGYNLEPTGKNDRQAGISPDRLVLLIERVGAPLNAHEDIKPEDEDQKDFFHRLTFPHYSEDAENATELVLYANGRILERKRSEFIH